MKIDSKTVTRAAAYVSQYMDARLPKHFVYHDLNHTISVVNATTEICDGAEVKGHDKKILQVAAWFHDLGYTKQVAGHEQFGASIAEEFLSGEGIRKEDIDRVKACILATRYPQHPVTRDEKILCDADMIHLGKKGFMTVVTPLRQEWTDSKNLSYSDNEWYQLNIDFLLAHKFQTAYCRKQYAPQKDKNVRKLRKLLSTPGAGVAVTSVIPKIERSRSPKIVKGVETLFKNSSRNHMELSAMADNKAHILLSISSLIISVVLSFSIQGISRGAQFILPAALLLVVCLTTIVLAVLTTKPKISKGTFTVEQIRSHEINLLFFGNFHKMDLSVYEWGIHELMADKEYLFNSMTKDIYYLGKVLAVKYKYLDIGYKVFMYGLIASVAAFSISLFSFNA